MTTLLLHNFSSALFVIFITLFPLNFSFAKLVKKTQIHMGTYFSISLSEKNMILFSPSFQIAKQLDNLLSTYKTDSEVSQLNKKLKIKASKQTLQVLKDSKRMNQRTNGFFDITIGSITNKVFQTNRLTPTALDQVKKNIKHINHKQIKINNDTITIKKNTSIDLGGIGKGFTVDQISKLLINKKVQRGIIAASGDIRCLHKCIFYIQNPFEKQNPYGPYKAKIKNLSISTSGIYEKNILISLEKNSIKTKKTQQAVYSHLINPKNGLSQNRIKSLSLFANGDNTSLDALATGIASMPLALAIDFLKKQTDLAYFIVFIDGSKRKSLNFNSFAASF